MSASESKKRSNSVHDKENWQYITFKARKGSKDRIVEAAETKGMSINGFIREAVSKAVMEATQKPLEPSHEDAAKAMLLRILKEEIAELKPSVLGQKSREELQKKYADAIENNPSLYKDIEKVLSAELPPKTKGKRIRDIENEEREHLRGAILGYLSHENFWIHASSEAKRVAGSTE